MKIEKKKSSKMMSFTAPTFFHMLLEQLSEELDMSKSEVIRTAVMFYAIILRLTTLTSNLNKQKNVFNFSC